jgi:hypothetical protein
LLCYIVAVEHVFLFYTFSFIIQCTAAFNCLDILNNNICNSGSVSLYYDLNVDVCVVLVFQAGSPDLARKLPNGDAAILQSPSPSVDKGTVTDSGGSNGKHGEKGTFLLYETNYGVIDCLLPTCALDVNPI